MNAIPTRYNGIQMRSRLEAHWAAMFDLMGWTWEYEPFDREGWIPDFWLGVGCRSYLVEVKPVVEWSDFSNFWPKIIATNPEMPVLLLGARLFRDVYESVEDYLMIGQIRDAVVVADLGEVNCPDLVIETATEGCVIGRCENCERIGLCGLDELNGLFDSSCCNMSGSSGGILHHESTERLIQSRWSIAKNKVQWRSPQ